MAKIRLNRDKRETLQVLAAQSVKATPIDPAIEERVAKAQSAYDKTHAAVVVEATKLVNKQLPEADIKVLKKYNVIRRTLRPMFVNLDTRGVFQIGVFNELKFKRDNPPPIFNTHYDDRTAWGVKHGAAREAAKFYITTGNLGTQHRPLTASTKLCKLFKTLHADGVELEIAEGLDQERRTTIMLDFNALITTATTFEDVCAVWPEAKTVTAQIVGASNQLSVMSNEAVARIQANMATRGVSDTE